MKVGVVGGGISGLVSAYVLAKAGVDVLLYEKDDQLGGHAKTVVVDGIDLDLGFMVFNPLTSPNMMELFERLGVDMELSDMSFSVSLDSGYGYEWGSRNGLSSLFSQKRNLLNPHFWHMLWEVTKFKDDALRYLELNQDISHHETLQGFIKSHGYSELFQTAYLVPMCSSIYWPCPVEQVLSFSAFSVLSFFHNHHNLQVFGRPQWLRVRNSSHTYVKKLKEDLESRGCLIRMGCSVQFVSKLDNGK
ncbi:putative protoporphyrinogen oxidase [Helianthus anomalus]